MDTYFDDELGEEVHYHNGMVWYGSGHGYRDEHGKPIKRTPITHPYSYDGFVTYKVHDDTEANNTIYTDRLLQWDWDKHNELCKKHFGNEGQYWSERSPDKIEAFLRDWCDDPELILVRVMQYCNQATGYPLWRLDFKQTLKDAD